MNKYVFVIKCPTLVDESIRWIIVVVLVHKLCYVIGLFVKIPLSMFIIGSSDS